MYEIKTYRRTKDMQRDMTQRLEDEAWTPVLMTRWFFTYTVVYRK